MAKAAQDSLISQADRSASEARRWKRELQLAAKREKDWRDHSEKIIKRYRGEERKRNRYNVLWSNTEILRPAYYNSKPIPDVRRRFRDADPIGKAVSEVLERCLQVVTDGASTDNTLKNDVLDALLCGRGVSRVRYIPQIKQKSIETDETDDAGDTQTVQSDDEELEYEQACIEHVDWRDFRHGFGRTWDEVPWDGFRHQLTRPDALKKFNEADLQGVKFALPITDDPKKPGDEVNELQKVAEFWEIWDKVGERVFFVQDDIQYLLYPQDNPDGEPPLQFEGFFPNPEPLRLVENTGSLLPIPPFDLYEEQANELDRISARIDKIVDKLRLRGIYDAKLPEIASLTEASDNELVPIQNAQGWSDSGLDGAISWMPIEKAAQVLEALYDARDRQKAIIDELTGISDIRRGATSAEETATAQEIKQNNGDVRLLRPRQEVQRYARDLLRLCGSVMAQKFGANTFAEMTDLQFPTAIEKQQLALRIQQAQQPPLPGAPPPPPPPDPALLQVPTWDDILGLMRSSALRKFKVDVETDSTVAGSLQSDMSGLIEVMNGIHEMLTGLAPIVASGALPAESAKELVLSAIRRARLGMVVEDAFEKLKAPNPPPPPPDHAIEVAQINAQSAEKIAQMKIAGEAQDSQAEHATIAQTEAIKTQLEDQRHQHEAQMKLQLDAATKQHEADLEKIRSDAETQRIAMNMENDRLIADATNQTKVILAQIAADQAAALQSQKITSDQQMQANQQDAETKAREQETQGQKEVAAAPTAAAYEAIESKFIPVMQELISHLNRPRRVMRDEGGKIVGVQ